MTTAANWRTARLSTGAHSAHHGHGGKSDNSVPRYTPANPAPFKFEINQQVKVIRPGLHKGMVGTISSRRAGMPNRYNVYLHIPDVLTPIFPFLETELEAISILPMVIPQKKRPDRFMCEWGVCDLSKHPNIPARWFNRNKPTGDVILLEAQSQSTRQQLAHAKFMAFKERVAALNIDERQTARMNAVLRMAVYAPRTSKTAPSCDFGAKGVLRSKGSKIRRYAA